MHDFFISYKYMNRQTAIEYYKYLKQRKLDVWFDQLIPKHYKNWNKEIKSNIIDSKFFLCLISKDTIKDKWVLNQLEIARRYNKRIMFINLDQTPISDFKKYKITEPVYNSIEEIEIDSYLDYEQRYIDYLYYEELAYKKLNNPYLSLGIISIITIITLFLGVNFFNIKIGIEIGYLFVGITLMYVLSFIPNKKIFIFNGVISILLLTYGMYVMDKFTITDISMIPMIYMFLYFFMFILRYSNFKKQILTYTIGLLTAIFLVAFIASVNIFFIYIFNIDVSWVNILMLLGFNVYMFFSSDNHYILNKEFKATRELIDGLDKVRKVENEYEN